MNVKFRAWDKKTKKMRAVNSIVFHYESEAFDFDASRLPKVVNLWGEDIIEQKPVILQREAKDVVLMQYTGHKIKGSDLYEGDIVRVEENGDGVDPDDKMTYYVCTWIQEWGMFALLRVDDEYSQYIDKGTESLDTSMFWTFPLDVEDIGPSQHFLCGNIYENPELLTNE